MSSKNGQVSQFDKKNKGSLYLNYSQQASVIARIVSLSLNSSLEDVEHSISSLSTCKDRQNQDNDRHFNLRKRLVLLTPTVLCTVLYEYRMKALTIGRPTIFEIKSKCKFEILHRNRMPLLINDWYKFVSTESPDNENVVCLHYGLYRNS